MKVFEQLTKVEKSILLIWGNYLNFSTKAHYPLERVKKKIKVTLPIIPDKDVKRVIRSLITSGFICRHKTGGNKTYELTPYGLKCCNILKREEEI